MKRIVFLFIFLFIGVVACADEEIHEFEVTGEGISYKEAFHDALVNGISQIYGFKMKSEEVRQTKIKELSAYVNDQSKSIGEIDINTQGRIDFKTEGFVQNYEVLSKSMNSSDLYEVNVLIKIASYKTPGISPNSRRKIAIIPFRTKQTSYSFRGGHILSSEISRQFTQKLVTEMTQTRRFTVLDREYMEEFLREKSLVLSADAPVSEQMKIGEVLGVDYLLVGTITEASQKQVPYTIQITGETGYDYSASFVADYRIMVMATRQIKWSDSVTISLGDAKIKSMVPSLRPEKIQQSLLGKAAQQIVHRAKENIYPIRVVKVQQNGELILNQGGATVSDGEMLDVFIKGERIVDPYTGESLGSSETWAATIKIVRVIPKMSYARVIKGQLATIQNGSICRRIAEKNNQTPRNSAGRKTDVQTTSGGGAVLPFD
jgi:curli biogenesis system outer membrane secretion channel CsgG